MAKFQKSGTGVPPVNHVQDARATIECLRFNLSRRDGLALIGVTRGRKIGVDVELVQADLPVLERGSSPTVREGSLFSANGAQMQKPSAASPRETSTILQTKALKA